MSERHPLDLNSPSSICVPCAKEMGGKWPDGHCATFWAGTCGYCKEETSCCDVTDWKWDKKDSSKERREI